MSRIEWDHETEAEKEERLAAEAGKAEVTPDKSWEEIVAEIDEHNYETWRAQQP